MTLEIVSRWYGTFAIDESGRLVDRADTPVAAAELRARSELRREGRLTVEDERVLSTHSREQFVTADRRIAAHGVRFAPESMGAFALPPPDPAAGAALRGAMLERADAALDASWDPSIHVEEAVRAMRDLDRAINLLGERVGSWASRDRPELDPGDAAGAARALLELGAGEAKTTPPAALAEARRGLARGYRTLQESRASIDRAIQESSPQRTPNLSALLGPELAAQMVAAAGGLDRLSRLPASTVQVLGAEKAFFEHLRGRAPPPRHGLLFLHPRIQSNSRAARGRLARALAGKVSIAARLDRAGRPVNPTLAAQFEARAKAVLAHPPRSGNRRRRPTPSI